MRAICSESMRTMHWKSTKAMNWESMRWVHWESLGARFQCKFEGKAEGDALGRLMRMSWDMMLKATLRVAWGAARRES